MLIRCPNSSLANAIHYRERAMNQYCKLDWSNHEIVGLKLRYPARNGHVFEIVGYKIDTQGLEKAIACRLNPHTNGFLDVDIDSNEAKRLVRQFTIFD